MLRNKDTLKKDIIDQANATYGQSSSGSTSYEVASSPGTSSPVSLVPMKNSQPQEMSPKSLVPIASAVAKVISDEMSSSEVVFPSRLRVQTEGVTLTVGITGLPGTQGVVQVQITLPEGVLIGQAVGTGKLA